MNKPLGILLRHILFFYFLFFIGRCIFLVYNFNEIQNENVYAIFTTIVYGLYLDSSMCAYLFILMVVPYIIFIFFLKPWAFAIIKFLSGFLILLYCLIIISELMLYAEWKTKLSFRAIAFLSNISEVIHIVSWQQILSGFTIIALLTFLFIYIQNNYFLKGAIPIIANQKKYSLPGVFIFLALIPIAIRGGFQPIPITQSDVYFSKNNTLNLAAINSIWNLGQSVYENRYTGNVNPYLFFDVPTRNRLLNDLLKTKNDSLPKVFNQKRPNVVVILLESWSADLVGAFNGKDSVAPNISKLARAGIRFTNCYSPGTLSDEGHVSILSGFPAQPLTVLTRQPQKYKGLSTLTKCLMDSGYASSYVYNGDLSYGNIKSFVYYNGFQNIYDKNNMEVKSWKSGRLGYHDAYLFERLKPKLNQLQSPFFLTAFTLSTHSPFDFEGERKIKNKGEFNAYMSAAVYSDSVIGSFMAYAKTQSWYANTVFVFLSDHSHPTPNYKAYIFPEDRRMVAFMCGGAIADDWKGRSIDYSVSQHDFAPSICQLLKIPHHFKYGKNVFNPNANHFAYYSYDVGFGFVTDSASYVYDLRSNTIKSNTFKSQQASKRSDSLAKAYLQSLYTDYLSF